MRRLVKKMGPLDSGRAGVEALFLLEPAAASALRAVVSKMKHAVKHIYLVGIGDDGAGARSFLETALPHPPYQHWLEQ